MTLRIEFYAYVRVFVFRQLFIGEAWDRTFMAGVGLHQRRCRHDDEIFEDLVAMLNVSFAICLLFVGQFSLIVETERPEFALPPEAIHNISGMNSAPPDCNAVGGERKMINFQCKGGRYRSFEIYIYIYYVSFKHQRQGTQPSGRSQRTNDLV